MNVSSAAARLGSPHEYVDYAASKGAVAALTTTTAAYYAAHGIRVNMIAPALTISRMSERAQADAGSAGGTTAGSAET